MSEEEKIREFVREQLYWTACFLHINMSVPIPKVKRLLREMLSVSI